MSNTRKEQRKDEEVNTVTQSTSTTTPTVSNISQVEQEQQRSVNMALDETKNNIRRATDEARSQIPRYTQATNEYQEQTIQTTREIADNFLESQKEIINSLQSVWVPALENAYGVFWNYWMSPRRATDAYASAVSSVTDNTVAAARIVNDTVFSNLDAFKTSVQNTRDNLKEVSRIGVNAAKTFEQTSRDTTTATRSTSLLSSTF
jgi:vacuolar-type H+-ATPase subunit H